MEKYNFKIYSFGLVYVSVCSSLPVEEVVKRVNLEHPTGISSSWSLDKEGEFKDGTPNPCPCEDYPETHKHYLLSC